MPALVDVPDSHWWTYPNTQAHGSLAIPSHVPRDANARRNIMVIVVDQGFNLPLAYRWRAAS